MKAWKTATQQLTKGLEVEFCESEEELLRKVFDVLNDYPFILTFNGDDFDLRYLAHRAYNLGFRKNDIPIDIGKRVCLLKYGIHIDLYKFFFNRSVQIYAYGGKYKDVSLDDVGSALIGTQKIHLGKDFRRPKLQRISRLLSSRFRNHLQINQPRKRFRHEADAGFSQNRQHAHGRR